MTKPMTTGQRALYEIAVDPERRRDFLIGIGKLETRAKARAVGVGLVAFVVGVLVGRM